MTVFMLNNFPVGTVLGVLMLYFSIFKWEKQPIFKVPVIDLHCSFCKAELVSK